jgi:hypothetical protein
MLLAFCSGCGACGQWRFRHDNPPPPRAVTADSLPSQTQPPSPPVLGGPLESSASNDAPVVERLPPLPEWIESAPPGPLARLESIGVRTGCHIWDDHKNFYSLPSMGKLFLGVSGAAVVANTRMDDDFHQWYQREARTRTSGHWADAVRDFGDGWIWSPSTIGMGLLGEYFEDRPVMGVLGEFGDRTTRAYLVGGPPMLLLQAAGGAGRPDDGSESSHWGCYRGGHTVSGHAFMGAVPFITAARMTDDPWAKGALYACSTLTGWSRINDDRHYLSQVWLGWWFAYLACDAVNKTNHEEQRITLAPCLTPEMSGVGVSCQW